MNTVYLVVPRKLIRENRQHTDRQRGAPGLGLGGIWMLRKWIQHGFKKQTNQV